MLLEIARKGIPTPLLLEKPELPDHLRVCMRAYNDLTRDGGIAFPDYVLWCETYGIRVPSIQFEFVWDVINGAASKVASWKAQKSSQKNSGETTSR